MRLSASHKMHRIIDISTQSKRWSHALLTKLFAPFFALFLTYRKIIGKKYIMSFRKIWNMSDQAAADEIIYFICSSCNVLIMKLYSGKWKMENHRHRSCAPLCANSGQATTLGSAHTATTWVWIYTYLYVRVAGRIECARICCKREIDEFFVSAADVSVLIAFEHSFNMHVLHVYRTYGRKYIPSGWSMNDVNGPNAHTQTIHINSIKCR